MGVGSKVNKRELQVAVATLAAVNSHVTFIGCRRYLFSSKPCTSTLSIVALRHPVEMVYVMYQESEDKDAGVMSMMDEGHAMCCVWSTRNVDFPARCLHLLLPSHPNLKALTTK